MCFMVTSSSWPCLNDLHRARLRSAALASLLIAALAAPAGAADGTPAAATPAAATPVSGTPAVTPAAAQTAAADAARRDACEAYVAVLSGRTKDAALLEDSDLQALARQVPDLAVCGAVRQDSDALCAVLHKDQGLNCIASRYVFHELRTNPKSRAFMLDNVKIKEWREFPEVAPYVDPFMAALREANLEKCAATGPVEFLCRAYITLDANLCSGADGSSIKGLSADDRKGLEKSCRRAIEENAARGRGLKELAASGAAPDQERAKAALGNPDACKPLEQQALAACVDFKPGTPGADGTPRSTPAR